jgi:ribosomal protein S12 methylthiotransferase accessory factor
VRWTLGFELPSGQPRYVPVQLAYMPWQVRRPDETLIGHATSSGIACAASLEEAVLNGLLEVIERDAVMLTWYGRLTLPRLDWTRDEKLVEFDRRYFAPTGLRYQAIDLSAFFGIPTVFGVVRGVPDELGALGVGAACAPTVAEAWRKALTEAFSVQRWIRDKALERPERVGLHADEIDSFEDHTLYYVTPERAELTAFLDSSTDIRDTRDVASLEGDHALAYIESAMRRLDVNDVTAVAVDVTAPDVRVAGFRVAHVVSPELCPLDVLADARFLGARRLYRAAYDAGLVDAPFGPEDLNPLPHPFP